MNQPHKGLTALIMALTLSGVLASTVASSAATTEYVMPQQGAMELSIGRDGLAPIKALAGKSFIIRTGKVALKRVSVSDPTVVDYTLLSPTELYMLPKRYGSTNITLWTKDDKTAVIDMDVEFDTSELESKLAQLLPDENGIKVVTAAKSLVLTGTVSSAVAASQAVDIADAYIRHINRDLVIPVVAGGGTVGGGTQVSVSGSTNFSQARSVAGVSIINMLRITEPMQVLLEVKVAEVSKKLLDKLGTSFSGLGGNPSLVTSLLALGIGPAGLLTFTGPNGATFKIDAEKEDGILRILAEPNIMAISGQEGSFLSGGKIFVPVSQATGIGGTTITLEEKEFGVRLKFLPTVLAGGRINLKVEPEVSEVVEGVKLGETALPSFSVHKASTTVQLNDGQSFAIAGLIKSNITEAVRRVPLLGEIPILGALFRSSEFKEGKTELMFVVTPRLVKPLPPNYRLPTDNFKAPDRKEFFLEGRMESATPPPAPAAPVKADPNSLRMN